MQSIEESTSREEEPTVVQKLRRSRRSALCSIALFVGGVALPIAALVVELTLGFCSMVFFDPIPTWGHIALVGSVPLANFLVLAKWFRPRFLTQRVLAAVLGFSLAISLVYSVLYLPVLPFALFYTMMSFTALFLPACITILPFGPALSLLAGLFSLQRIKRRALETSSGPILRYACTGAAFGFFGLVWCEAPRVITRMQMEALKINPADAEAIRTLRKFGDEELILRAAYGSSRPSADFVLWTVGTLRTPSFFGNNFGNRQSTIDSQAARRIFYQVTGESFNSRRRPTDGTGFGWFDRASEIGRTAVGGRSDSVELINSTLDGSIDPQTLASYTEWTMVFRNTGSSADEARALLRLPAGGVVSRATLWVNGEEREAAFGGRAETIRAYQQVAVVRRRDPLLVTSAGPDQVLVQCFPIPAGGEMKIRIGITAPLVARSGSKASLTLPHFVDSNFDVQKQAGRSVWLESKTPLDADSGDLAAARADNALYTLRGDAPFETRAVRVEIGLEKLPGAILSADHLADSASVFRQTVDEAQLPASRNVILVIDGSKSMHHFAADLIAAIQHLPPGIGTAVYLAGENVVPLTTGIQTFTPDLAKRLASGMRGFEFTGGRDNSAAVLTALDLSLEVRDSLVVWIHGPQPIGGPVEQFAQRKLRRANIGRVVQIELLEGANELSAGLSELGLLQSLPPAFSAKDPVAQLLTAAVSGTTYYRIRREQVTAAPEDPAAEDRPQYQHLNRLAVLETVNRLLESNNLSSRNAAKELAVRYRLVTPASGAVVLENDAQYRENGLEPPTADTVPVIPEPDTWVLIIAASAVIIFAARRQQCLA